MKVLGEFKDNCLPDVETDRLILRQRRLADAPDVFAYASNVQVAGMAGFPQTQDLADTQHFLEDWVWLMDTQNIPKGYAITLKGEDRLIGTIDFNGRHGNQAHILSMGFVLHPDYWGQGLMVEAGRALIDTTFTLLPEIYKIEVGHYDFNQQSRRVIEKLGFHLEGILRGAYYPPHQDVKEPVASYRYGLLRPEWKKEKGVLYDTDVHKI